MAIKQTIWSLDEKKELLTAELLSENELEGLISEHISLLSENWMIVGRQVITLFGGRIDLLCIDMGGNLIVVELKKNMTPREVTAQALDYASWVKSVDADQLAEIYLKFSKGEDLSAAYKKRFGKELTEENDDRDVQIVIVATNMDGSTERIIRYLQGYGIGINVLFFNVFAHQGQRFLSRAWMFEEDTIVKPHETSSRTWNGEYYFAYGVDAMRSWDDAMKYGFVSAGGGSWYTNTMLNLEPGNRVWVYIPQGGYVGVGTVTEPAKPAREVQFEQNGEETSFFDLPLTAKYHKDAPQEKEEFLVKVKWDKVIPKNKAVSEYGFFANQNTVCRPKTDKWDFTIRRLKELWSIE